MRYSRTTEHLLWRASGVMPAMKRMSLPLRIVSVISSLIFAGAYSACRSSGGSLPGLTIHSTPDSQIQPADHSTPAPAADPPPAKPKQRVRIMGGSKSAIFATPHDVEKSSDDPSAQSSAKRR